MLIQSWSLYKSNGVPVTMNTDNRIFKAMDASGQVRLPGCAEALSKGIK